jgi:hypothetical protein
MLRNVRSGSFIVEKYPMNMVMCIITPALPYAPRLYPDHLCDQNVPYPLYPYLLLLVVAVVVAEEV